MDLSPAGLQSTLADHEALDEALMAVRRQVVAGALAEARRRLALAERWFAAHRREEELRWIPLYVARCVPPANASAEVLLRDHRLIGSLFARSLTLEGLELVDLLEDLAGALEHHDARERRSLKPMLEAVVTDRERRALLAGHAKAMQRLDAPPSRLEEDWRPTPDGPLTEVRQALLNGQVLPVGDDRLPPEPFRRKALRILMDLPEERVERLARLRRLAWMHAAR